MALFRKRPDRIRGVAGSLDGKTALVIDGSSGAGSGIVRVLAAAGASTHFATPNRPAADLLERELANSAGPVSGKHLDDPEPKSLGRLLETVEPDLVVVNPTSLDRSQQGLDVAIAVTFATQTADRWRDHGRIGVIVAVSEIDSNRTEAGAGALFANAMRRLATEYAPSGIRANTVATGPVGADRRGRPRTSRVSPLGHTAVHPVEVGKAVWFLLNDDLSAGMTGSVLTIDRGTSLLRPDW